MNNEALIPIARKLGPALYRFFLARMRPHLAEEGVQEVFLRLINNLGYSADKGNLEAFAWGIALNVQKEISRKNPFIPENAENPSDDQEMASQEDRSFAALRHAVSLLEEPERVVFQLVLADLSIKEIAAQLDMPEGTVKSHVHRGKEKIKLTMTKWGYS